MKISKDVARLVGNTPLLEFGSIAEGGYAKVLGKCEFMNPSSSVKDRIATAMVEDARRKGRVRDDSVFIEATSGNTGIALASICASLGQKLILSMPESMSKERRDLLEGLGAEILLTPASEGMKGAVAKAKELLASDDRYIMLKQFENPANPAIHRETTAQEIWDDTEGKIDVFVAGVGTGGTISGVGQFLKEKRSSIEIVALEPEGSAVLSGENAGPHGIQGIGAGFIPEVLDRSVIDKVMKVRDEDAKECARELGKKEGILCGISAGANAFAALSLAKQEQYRDKVIVTILCDTGERYLSTNLYEAAAR